MNKGHDYEATIRVTCPFWAEDYLDATSYVDRVCGHLRGLEELNNAEGGRGGECVGLDTEVIDIVQTDHDTEDLIAICEFFVDSHDDIAGVYTPEGEKEVLRRREAAKAFIKENRDKHARSSSDVR